MAVQLEVRFAQLAGASANFAHHLTRPAQLAINTAVQLVKLPSSWRAVPRAFILPNLPAKNMPRKGNLTSLKRWFLGNRRAALAVPTQSAGKFRVVVDYRPSKRLLQSRDPVDRAEG